MRNNEERLEETLRQQAASTEPIPAFLQQAQSDQNINLSFIAPTDHVPLPSKGLFYPDGHPLKGQETIEVKEMTAREEDILNSKALIKKGLVFDKLISSIVVDRNIKAEDLLVCDRNAILIAARASAYGSEYAYQSVCPNCGVKERKTINVSEFLQREAELPEMVEGTARLENGNLVLKLPKTGWIVECRLLTGADEQRVVRLTEAKKKINPSYEAGLVDNLSLFVVSIEGVTQPNLIGVGLQAMPARDSKFLRDMYQKYSPKVDLKTNFVCGSCEFEQEVEVPLTADFFWVK